MNTYQEFLDSKSHVRTRDGFAPTFVPDAMFDFQRALVDWSCRQGRAAIFADCGMGKTLIQLVWAENVRRRENRPVLILTPLAVAAQTVDEATRFGIEAARSHAGEITAPIVVANYQRLHHFNPDDFAGVVCDESSILKSFDGATRTNITTFMRKVRFRLLCTATAAPNDYTELGTSSEALGHLGATDMLNRFFVNDKNNSGTRRHYGQVVEWRFKGHAEAPFWKWVCSWARAVRKPSDLSTEGQVFDDGRFVLPPLDEHEHVVESRSLPEGFLFTVPAEGLHEQRQERKRTIAERCEKVSELVAHDQPALVWCHLNAEGDMLEKLIPGAVQVSGKDDDESQERKLLGFARGEHRVLVTKPVIGAWGLNFQHCAHVTFFPSHSFEQYYQSVRRCWRFGQKRAVRVDVVATEGDLKVLDNLQRKSRAADAMFAELVAHMNDAMRLERSESFPLPAIAPHWL